MLYKCSYLVFFSVAHYNFWFLCLKNVVSLWVCNFYCGQCELMVNDLKINLISSLIQQCIIHNK